MKIKRYFGNTNREAMTKLKKELGENAVILHTRKIKQSGLLGFLKKPLIEIVAAIDDVEPMTKTTKKTKRTNDSFVEKPIESLFTDKQKNNEVNKEVVKLRKTVESFMYNMEKNGSEIGEFPVEVKLLHKKLLNNGIEHNISTKLLNELVQEYSKLEGRIEYNDLLQRLLKKHLGKVTPITLEQKQKIVLFVGPTGVGKTTTLAKIAAQYALVNREKIGLITADTYRIAAVEQLKTYSEILDIPLKIIYDSSEITEAINDYYDKELILVDTAGRSHKNNEKIIELKEMLTLIKEPEIFLVLSSTTNYTTVKSIIDKYSFIDNYKLIFTKLDESDNYGIIMSTCYDFKNSLSYITTGQSVPEDIKLANTSEIAKSLLEELNHE